MNSLLIDLIGAIGFQCNDTFTTYIGIKLGIAEGNKIFKFLEKGKVEYFILVGFIKVLLALFLYLYALVNPAYGIFLLYDLYLELGVTLWNIYMIYDDKVRGG